MQRCLLLTRQGRYHLFLYRPDHGLYVFVMLPILCGVCGLGRGPHGGLFPLRIEECVSQSKTRRTEVPAHVHFAGGVGRKEEVPTCFVAIECLIKGKGWWKACPERLDGWGGRPQCKCGGGWWHWVVGRGVVECGTSNHGPMGHPSPAFLAFGYRGMHILCLVWSDLGKA